MPKIFNKIENWVFWIFLFAIPISLRHIFAYQPLGYVEWTSLYLYASDILLIILFVFWAANRVPQRDVAQALRLGAWRKAEHRDDGSSQERADYRSSRGIRFADLALLAFVIIAGISIKNAIAPPVAWFAWVKLLEGVLLYFYVKSYAVKRFDLSYGFVALVLGGLFQSVIGIVQFMTQSSLGLKWLGESVLSSGMSGIAAFIVNGEKIIRAYGTTPHANVLAAYLFVALGAFYSIAIYQKRSWFWYLFHAITLWAFFLTFSRVIVGIWIINFCIRCFLIRFDRKFEKKFWDSEEMRQRSIKILWTTIIAGVLFLGAYWPYVLNRSSVSTGDEAIQLRVFYNHESLASGHNWLGLGMGNFVPWLMEQDLHLSHDLYQPVHNIYLLIYSETGIIGLGLFLLFLALLLYDFYRRLGFKKLYHFSFGLIILSMLVFGLFDHFLWTIQSGRLLFWLVLGLLAGAE